MKTIIVVILIALAVAGSSLFAQTIQPFTLSGPANWTPGTMVTLSVSETFSGFGAGSLGLSYWLEASGFISPYLIIKDITYYTFTHGNPVAFPFVFNSTDGADSGFATTTTANNQSGDLGRTSLTTVPDGTYKIADITFSILPGAPTGPFMLCTTQINPRVSQQFTTNMESVPIPQGCATFNIIPEPSTLSLLALVAVGAGVAVVRRRKSNPDG